MAEPDSTTPFSISSINRESSAAAAPSASSSSSSSSSQVREEEEYHPFSHDNHGYDHYPHGNPELERHVGISHPGNVAAFDDISAPVRQDTWSCFIVVLTFWFFVSMTLIMGVYGSVNLRLGPSSSILFQPNRLFVESIKVEQLDDGKPGLRLYGFNRSPTLDVVAKWSETHSVSVPADSHTEWIHYLNEGSQISISYSLKSTTSSIYLIIAQGDEGLAQWLQDPAYPNTTLSWNLVHGSGIIQQAIYKSSAYYVAVGNLNSEKVKAKLNLRIRALLYNTTEAYYKCAFRNGQCSLNVLLTKRNAVVLTSSGPEGNASREEWYVKLSYEPRWITYIVGIGVMTLLMLVVFNFLNKFQINREDETVVQYGEIGSHRAPLLSHKDDDLSSLCSSYDSISDDDRDLEDFLAAGSVEGKSVQDGENGNNTRRLCAICFDAPRDCFFLPCGHCVACFECGTRIAEAAGTCPICRRKMKKVRKIFTV